MLKTIPVEEAVGHVLVHDITEIRPGEFKGPAFKKGHIVTEKDIPHLKRLGKERLYVLTLEPGELHEDEAALRLATLIAGENVVFDPKPSEGKISLKAKVKGLLKVDVDTLTQAAMIPEVCISSLHNNTVVSEGQVIAATRVIPLVIKAHVVEIVENICGKKKIFEVKAFNRLSTGLIITGNEVYYGLIEDKFNGAVTKKLRNYECDLINTIYCPDDKQKIMDAINSLISENAQLIIISGGMSVDPDDVTRLAIAEAGATDIVYGTSILPGAMFLYAKIKGIPIMGLPACVIYFKTTVFDIMLPRVLAGEEIRREDIARLAHGGLCLNCEECRYPVCPFGKA